jgi:hypothetical protein
MNLIDLQINKICIRLCFNQNWKTLLEKYLILTTIANIFSINSNLQLQHINYRLYKHTMHRFFFQTIEQFGYYRRLTHTFDFIWNSYGLRHFSIEIIHSIQMHIKNKSFGNLYYDLLTYKLINIDWFNIRNTSIFYCFISKFKNNCT